MTEQIVRREMDRWQWMCKKHEMFHNVIDRVNNKKELTDEDWDLLNVEFRVYEDGAFPLYENVLDLKQQTVTEVGLFLATNDKSAEATNEIPDGMAFADSTSETKIEN